MEDQQPDSGDLTTDEASDAKAVRRRHRMPLRKDLAPSDGEAVDSIDEKPETVEPATDESQPVAGFNHGVAPGAIWRLPYRLARLVEGMTLTVFTRTGATTQ